MIFVWEFSFGTFRLGSFARELPLAILDSGTFAFDLQLKESVCWKKDVRSGMFPCGIWLGSFRSGSFTWELSLGIVCSEIVAWKLMLGILSWFAWDLSLADLRLGTVAWNH